MIKKFENYMSREEMCGRLCRCGYTMNELEKCSNQELEEMCRNAENEDENNNSHAHNMTHESKGEKWIQDAIKRPGALRSKMGKKEDEKISKSEINQELSKLKAKDKDKDKEGVQGLSKKDLTKFRQLNLAKTLKGIKEHQETQNYMFFANLQTIKRLIDGILEMDKNEVDRILTDGHGWALDHIATSKDDVEEVFNFLASHCEEGCNCEPTHQEPSHEETESNLAHKDLDAEMKGIVSFANFKK